MCKLWIGFITVRQEDAVLIALLNTASKDVLSVLAIFFYGHLENVTK